MDSLSGSREAKRRLRAMLETLAGRRSVRKVAAELGIGEAAFYKLRTRTLAEALEGLEPRPVGRPPGERETVSAEVVEALERELARARVREELALGLPALKRGAGRKKGR